MASLIQWTRTRANSGRWWGTGKPCVLQSMGLWRVGHNLVTEQQKLFLLPLRLGFICTSDADFLMEFQGQGLGFRWWSVICIVGGLLSFALIIRLPWLYTTIPRACSNLFPYGGRSSLGNFCMMSFLEWIPILVLNQTHTPQQQIILLPLTLEKVSSQCDKTVRGVKKTTATTQDTKGGHPQPREILFL